jgi:anhydro-N-acetylmuramic acid kinase
MPDTGLYIGVISGTSIDAIDCALIECSHDAITLLATQSGVIPDALRERIVLLCNGKNIDLPLLGSTDIDIGRAFADTINSLLTNSGIKKNQITAIGSHGQTIYHQPEGSSPFSLQIGDPNIIAELTGITTVADFRRRDMAAGGQGAPLAPLFHQQFFHHPTRTRCVVNIGGISNITWINPNTDSSPSGYDTGPGNVLMDGWIRRHLNLPYDNDGQWAGRGQVSEILLQRMLAEPYFKMKSPKSTGRELFNSRWLDAHIEAVTSVNVADVQRTLLELTATTISDAIHRDLATQNSTAADDLIVCGGGAHNAVLLTRLQNLLPNTRVVASDEHGLAPDWVEAATFAWLANKTLLREKVKTQSLTGAKNPVILGGVYYA